MASALVRTSEGSQVPAFRPVSLTRLSCGWPLQDSSGSHFEQYLSTASDFSGCNCLPYSILTRFPHLKTSNFINYSQNMPQWNLASACRSFPYEHPYTH